MSSEVFGRCFVGSGVLLETCLGDLGGLLWIHSYFFGHLGGSWSHFGWPWALFGRLLGAFGEHLGAFGWPVAGFLVFFIGKRETVKSVVLLREMEVLRGGGELVGGILSSFWWLEGCLEAFWEVEAMRLDIGGFEAGKWEAGGWNMGGQNKRRGGVHGSWQWLTESGYSRK